MLNVPLPRQKQLDRPTERGQVLVEALILMTVLATILMYFIQFTEKQNELFKKIEFRQHRKADRR